jgi:hypothetical protein
VYPRSAGVNGIEKSFKEFKVGPRSTPCVFIAMLSKAIEAHALLVV